MVRGSGFNIADLLHLFLGTSSAMVVFLAICQKQAYRKNSNKLRYIRSSPSLTTTYINYIKPACSQVNMEFFHRFPLQLLTHQHFHPTVLYFHWTEILFINSPSHIESNKPNIHYPPT